MTISRALMVAGATILFAACGGGGGGGQSVSPPTPIATPTPTVQPTATPSPTPTPTPTRAPGLYIQVVSQQVSGATQLSVNLIAHGTAAQAALTNHGSTPGTTVYIGSAAGSANAFLSGTLGPPGNGTGKPPMFADASDLIAGFGLGQSLSSTFPPDNPPVCRQLWLHDNTTTAVTVFWSDSSGNSISPLSNVPASSGNNICT